MSAKSRQGKKGHRKQAPKAKTFGVVNSPKTGTHIFDLAAIDGLVDQFLANETIKQRRDILNAVPLFNFLFNHPAPSVKLLVPISIPLFRVAFGVINPLSIAGSLSSGGRFNTGGAQSIDLVPLNKLRPKACIYASDSIDCAKKEASVGGLPSSNEVVYKIVPKTSLQIWDLPSVIQSLQWPNLQQQVDMTLPAARWDLQKSPLMSQILGSWLREKGGHGLFSYSTRFAGGLNFALFAETDEAIASLLSFEKIEEPQQLVFQVDKK